MKKFILSLMVIACASYGQIIPPPSAGVTSAQTSLWNSTADKLSNVVFSSDAVLISFPEAPVIVLDYPLDTTAYDSYLDFVLFHDDGDAGGIDTGFTNVVNDYASQNLGFFESGSGKSINFTMGEAANQREEGLGYNSVVNAFYVNSSMLNQVSNTGFRLDFDYIHTDYINSDIVFVLGLEGSTNRIVVPIVQDEETLTRYSVTSPPSFFNGYPATYPQAVLFIGTTNSANYKMPLATWMNGTVNYFVDNLKIWSLGNSNDAYTNNISNYSQSKYFGPGTSDGDWRIITTSTNMAFQVRQSGVWVDAETFEAP